MSPRLGEIGVFVAVAIGSCAYAALIGWVVFCLRDQTSPPHPRGTPDPNR
jgi:hypothetical protein